MPNVPWPKVGEVNILDASLGARGEGKSTHQAVRAYELQRQFGGAYVIGHSFGRRMPRKLPPGIYGGATLPITYHRSVKQLAEGIRKHPDRWHFIAPPMEDEDPYPDLPRSSADELLRFAIRLSFAVRTRYWLKEHPFRFTVPKNGADYEGIRCPPIIVLIDEGIAVGGAAGGKGDKSKRENTWFLEFLYSLRHLHIALLYAIQDPTARSWRVMEQANTMNIFWLHHEWALNAIRAAGASMDQLDEIKALDRFEHVTLHFTREQRAGQLADAPAPATAATTDAPPPPGG